jgi:hypothetical protein
MPCRWGIGLAMGGYPKENSLGYRFIMLVHWILEHFQETVETSNVMGNSTVSDSYVKHRQIKIRFGLFGQR